MAVASRTADTGEDDAQKSWLPPGVQRAGRFVQALVLFAVVVHAALAFFRVMPAYEAVASALYAAAISDLLFFMVGLILAMLSAGLRTPGQTGGRMHGGVLVLLMMGIALGLCYAIRDVSGDVTAAIAAAITVLRAGAALGQGPEVGLRLTFGALRRSGIGLGTLVFPPTAILLYGLVFGAAATWPEGAQMVFATGEELRYLDDDSVMLGYFFAIPYALVCAYWISAAPVRKVLLSLATWGWLLDLFRKRAPVRSGLP